EREEIEKEGRGERERRGQRRREAAAPRRVAGEEEERGDERGGEGVPQQEGGAHATPGPAPQVQGAVEPQRRREQRGDAGSQDVEDATLLAAHGLAGDARGPDGRGAERPRAMGERGEHPGRFPRDRRG